MYQALCKCWKSDTEEEEIIKLILKNIHPKLVSQHYEQRKTLMKSPKPAASVLTVLPPTRENPVRQNRPSPHRPPQTYCWRCKGSHAPASCPQLNPDRVSSSPRPQQQQPDKPSYHQGGHATLGSLVPQSQSGAAIFVFPSDSTLPCQVIAPLSIGPWKGTAILDTGSSYILNQYTLNQ